MSALPPIADSRSAPGLVRFGSKADMCSARAYVRFTPESDIKCDIMECPLRAKGVRVGVVGCLIAEFKIQIFQVNLAALFPEHSRVKAPRLFWANLYEIPNRTWA